MFILYNLIFLVFSVFYLPVYIFRKKFHRGFLSRLGVLPKNLNLNRPIWIHAVSVGETMAVRGLLEELRIAYPQKRFVISTVTPTGNKIAKTIAKGSDFVTYLPLDFSFIVKSIIDKINPSLFILAETEIWPNLISYLYKKNIPTVVVNGRISDRSFSGYRSIKFLVKPILNRINLFCMQTTRDQERLASLGVSIDKLRVAGNMKFDTMDYTDKTETDCRDYKIKLKLIPGHKLLVAGSTHAGEEKIILEVYKNLLTEYPDLRFLIVPRHPERTPGIERLIAEYDFQPLRISKLNLSPNTHNLSPVFILDTIGQLLSFYSIADIVFVGGSLVRIGGHNILEPAALGKPILFGPYMFNFCDIAEMFLKADAVILVHNQKELLTQIRYLLNNPSYATALSQRAKELILENQGATRRTLEPIKNLSR